MSETVTIYLDDKPCAVPKGANLVDAAKMHGVDIPVFCYHPKLKPAGKCRMCLVELGAEQRDRATSAPVLDSEGHPVVRWHPKLATACTTTTAEGMHVRTLSALVARGRKDVLEFLLTSHPLDCPTCDKGGECLLQDLTVRHGPAVSRFLFTEQQLLDKHVPLGEQIWLDQERCIQCARCVRYCEDIVDDPVLDFYQRGRRLQIISVSEPGFDSKFSGNTTDLCPVGALTTADFRFGARPWELTNTPSICAHCPVGCNITLGTRPDRAAAGKRIIKRVMPRQNEQVNEIWICDKGRFGHHFAHAADRLTAPLLRQNGALETVGWNFALDAAANALRDAGDQIGALAGPMLSNEDLWALRNLLAGCGASAPGVWPAEMAGGDLPAEFGLPSGSNFGDMGAETCFVVLATDLEEEAPMWWHRVKTAVDRGAALVVLNGRATKLDRYTPHVVHYKYGTARAAFDALVRRAVDFRRIPHIEGAEAWHAAFADVAPGNKAAGAAIKAAENLVCIIGTEGLGHAAHEALLQAAANLLTANGHVGKVNNGLLAVWPGANTQGALDMGFAPEHTARILHTLDRFKVLVIAGADPLRDDMATAEALRTYKENGGVIIMTTMFMTATAALADVVLPRLSFAEREGTFTSGERRIQCFSRAIEPRGGARPDWQTFSKIGVSLGQGPLKYSAAALRAEIAQHLPHYAEARSDNAQWPTIAERPGYTPRLRVPAPQAPLAAAEDTLLIVPVRLLYDRGIAFYKTALVHARTPTPYVVLHAEDAQARDIQDGAMVRISVAGCSIRAHARVMTEPDVPKGAALLPMDLDEAATLTRTVALGSVSRQET